MRIGQGDLQLLVDELFSERHLLICVSALSVPTDNALLQEKGNAVWALLKYKNSSHDEHISFTCLLSARIFFITSTFTLPTPL